VVFDRRGWRFLAVAILLASPALEAAAVASKGRHPVEPAVATAAMAPVGSAVVDDGRRTLERIHDPVVIAAQALAGLGVRDTSRFRLVRFEGGRATAVPFQFDQRDQRGEVVVPGPPTFEMDANDELVFMAKDAGDHAGADPCAEGACEGALEIRIAEPAGGKCAWVYLLAFREPPPTPKFDPYVTFDDEGREARSANYRVEYARARNYFTGMTVERAAGGDGANLLRRTHMIGSPTFSLLLSKVTLDFTEQNSIVEIDGVREGPVRAVRRARLSVDLGPMFPELPSGLAYTYHYGTAYFTPSKVSFPWIMVKTLHDFRFETVMDFVPVVPHPARYYDAANPGGVSLAADGPVLRSTEDHDWWVYSSDAGTMLHAFEIPELWKEWGIVRGAVVRTADDETQTASAKGQAGESRAAGYSLLNMTRLREAGSFELMMASVVLPSPYRAGDEAGPMAMLHAPLATEVRRIH